MRRRRQNARRSSNSARAMPVQGFTAPSRIDLPASGTTRSMSTSMMRPKPRQAGQAPAGELKEKVFAVGCRYSMSQTGHWRAALKRSVRSPAWTSVFPRPARRAVSRESTMRLRSPFRKIRRSATTSRIASPRPSSRGRISPPFQMRSKPERRSVFSRAEGSPFDADGKVRTTGLPSGMVAIASKIDWAVSFRTGLPQPRQVSTAMRA